MSSSPVLALPDLAKPFEVQTDASDYALGGVLLQEGHPYLVDLVGQGKTPQLYMEDGFLKVKRNQLYVPKGGDLRRTLLAECHDTLWVGHPGEERTMALLRRAYYWPQMANDVAHLLKPFREDTEDPSRSQLTIPSIREPNSTGKRRVEAILDDR
uniref:Uncharacterized protein LOC104217178 n=1 Tax=Nicotiana sylvestris TaxID=4096 RepID=A0A1U7VL06_NICSY